MADQQQVLDDAIDSLEEDSKKLHDIVHGDKNSVVSTDNGDVKTVAKAIADFGESSNYITTDFNNAPDLTLETLGFAGFSKINKNHTSLSLSTLGAISVNSIYVFEDKSDAPFTPGAGVVHTMVRDDNSAIQIVYKLQQTIGTFLYCRVKNSGSWGAWESPQSGSSSSPTGDVSRAIALANLLTGKGDIIYHNGVSNSRLSIGNNNEVLTVKDGDISWSKVTSADSTTKIISSNAVKGLIETNNQYVTSSGGVIMQDGSLRTWGDRDNFQLGDGLINPAVLPDKIVTPLLSNAKSGVKKWVKSNYNNICLLDDGNIYVWGDNSSGCLGVGNNVEVMLPTKVVGVSSVSDVSMNYNNSSEEASHSLMLTTAGEILAAGSNINGELGTGDTISLSVHAKVSDKTDWAKIWSIGNNKGRSFALDRKGNLYGCGYNQDGGLGLGDNNNVSSFTKIMGSVAEFKPSFDKDGVTGGRRGGGVPAVGGFNIARTTDNKIYSWGLNNSGQLGKGNTINYNTPQELTILGNNNKLIDCIGGYQGFSCAVKSDNSVMGCGYNGNSILGSDYSNLDKFTTIVNSRRDGRNIVQILLVGAYNEKSVVILYDDGVVRACGYNYACRLGVGNVTNPIDTIQDVVTPTNSKIVKIAAASGGILQRGSGRGSSTESKVGTFLCFLTDKGDYYQTGLFNSNLPLGIYALVPDLFSF